MTYIHITPDRLQKAREEKEIIRAYFNKTNNRIIEREVYGDNQAEAYVKFDGYKYPVEKSEKGLYNHWWIV